MPKKKKETDEEEGKKVVEKVVKTTLNKIIHKQHILTKNFGPDFDKKEFVSFILNYVKTFSQAVHKGSILFNIYLLECLQSIYLITDKPSKEDKGKVKSFKPEISKVTKASKVAKKVVDSKSIEPPTKVKKPKLMGLDHIKNNEIISYKFFSMGICGMNEQNFGRLWDKYFFNHPLRFNSQHIAAQAFCSYGITYDTNFFNSLRMNYKNRQLEYIKYWLKENNLDYEPKFVQAKINNWKYTSKTEKDSKKESTPHDHLIKFIEQERLELNIKGMVESVKNSKSYKESKKNISDDEISMYDGWLSSVEMRTVLVRYYHKILVLLERHKEAKKFTLAPITKIANMNIHIDSTVLLNILGKFLKSKEIKRNATKLSGLTRNEDDNKLAWSYVFNIKRIESYNKYSHFSYTIDTDGVSTSIHYKRFPADEKPPYSLSNLTEKEIMEAKNQRIIAFDPGRTNLLSGVEKDQDGNIKKYELKKSTYYNATGMTKASIYKKNHLDKINEAELKFREHSLKTTNIEIYKKFIANYLLVYDDVWNVRTTKKWINQKFRVYTLKQKFVDNIINCIIGDVPDKEAEKKRIIIAYGDAKFDSTGKGEKAGPTSWLSKKISQKVKTVFIDEYNTTKKCNCCGETLCVVEHDITKEEYTRRRNKVKGKLRKRKFEVEPDEVVKEEEKDTIQTVEIRGLRWCETSHTYKNRDLNAALNILDAFNFKKENYKNNPDARPKHLIRDGLKNPKIIHKFDFIEMKESIAEQKLARELKPKTVSTVGLVREKNRATLKQVQKMRNILQTHYFEKGRLYASTYDY